MDAEDAGVTGGGHVGSERAERLSLLASAVAGAPLLIAQSEPGTPVWTDGATIFLDESLAPDEQLAAVAVQASLVASGSIEPEVLAELDRGRLTASRFLAVEGHRALAEMGDLLPPAVRGMADHSIASRSHGPSASAALARSRDKIDPPPALFGVVKPKQLRAARVADAQRSEAMHVPYRDRTDALRDLDDGEDTERDGGFDQLNPVGGGGALGRLLARALGTSRSTSTGTPGAETPTHRTKAGGRVGRGAVLSRSAAEPAGDADALAPRSMSFDEWNVFKHEYRTDWCSVSEVSAPTDGSRLQRSVVVPRLRRSLSRLGLDLSHYRRQPQGDDIDLDATVEAQVEIAAGSTPQNALYLGGLRRRRDISVLVLLDVSGSAREPSSSGATVHEHQVATAAALCEALFDLGDRVALYGFRSHGRSAVEAIPVKTFEDRFDETTRQRLGSLSPGGYTRMGAAIRFGTAVLAQKGATSRRLLVVVSDGFAYDHGYEGDYAEADARRALAEARRAGTGCLCLSVGASADADTLRRVFGTAAHASMRRTDDLVGTAATMFATALRLAEVQRRSSQRLERTNQRLKIERRSA